jgi:hypothetical protein
MVMVTVIVMLVTVMVMVMLVTRRIARMTMTVVGGKQQIFKRGAIQVETLKNILRLLKIFAVLLYAVSCMLLYALISMIVFCVDTEKNCSSIINSK